MRTRILVLTVSFLFLALPIHGEADTIIFDLNSVLSGYAPAGNPTVTPWLTATFTDITTGVVRLTLTSNLTGDEFVQGNAAGNGQFGWGFNFLDDGNVGSLILNYQSGSSQASPVLLGQDQFNAGDQGGDFDILFVWNNGTRFGKGDTAVYLITGNNISASNFNVLSEDVDAGYYSVAKIQGISIPGVTEDGSGWIAHGAPVPDGASVPEPATIFLLGSGLIGVGVSVRRKFKR